MFARWFAHVLLAVTCSWYAASIENPGIAQTEGLPTSEEVATIKRALQELQEFIGEWHLEALRKSGGKLEVWKETVRWGWQFPQSGPRLHVEFSQGKGKFFTHGYVTYDVAAKQYRLVLHTPENKELDLRGQVIRGTLKAESKDSSGDIHRVTMTTLAEGIRFQLRYDRQEGGRGLFLNVLGFQGNRAGESFAARKKAPECIVSGGAATIPVTYQGKQYFVCCTGCRDEFYANPEKYIAAAAKK
jgi:YHS domain-containing protein